MIDPANWPGGLAYVGIFVAAAVEGEIVFVTAATLAALGRLNPFGVFVAGALGGSAGDQFYFYALHAGARGWLSRFLNRIPRHELLARRIRERSTEMILACRFLPGLRIAIPLACASAGVSPFRFSVLSLIGSCGWAAVILFVVVYAGPAAITFKAWWTPIVPAALFLAFIYWLGRASRNRLEQPEEMSSGL